MSSFKKIIPSSLKLLYRINERRYKDIFNGTNKKFARQISKEKGLYPVITIEQAVKLTPSSGNKIHTL